MKIAVCVSGICRGKVQYNIENMKHHFPDADFFFATWKGRESDADNNGIKDYFVYQEPQIHYHPIKDVDGPPAPKLMIQRQKCRSGEYGAQWQGKSQHHTKQILIHDMLLKDISSDYDMIIRARFDTWLSRRVDFSDYLQKSYKKNIAVGFGTRTSRHRNVDQLSEVLKIYPNGRDDSVSQDWGWYLMDPLIFHPRSMWNHDLVDELHQTGQLAAAEFGWYQILSEPFGDNHTSVYGGAQIEKYL